MANTERVHKLLRHARDLGRPVYVAGTSTTVNDAAWAAAIDDASPPGLRVTFWRQVPAGVSDDAPKGAVDDPVPLSLTFRYWSDGAGSRRSEVTDGYGTTIVVVSGGRWAERSDDGHIWDSGSDDPPSMPAEEMLDPSRLVGEAHMEVVGRRTLLERSVIDVRARDVIRDPELDELWPPGDEFLIAVDAELGVLFEFVSFFRGDEIEKTTLQSFDLDPQVPPDLFRLS